MLRAFKNALFDSEELIENQYVPLPVWYEVGEYEMNHLFSNDNNYLNDVVLTEVLDKERNLIDLTKFNDLVDLFFYKSKKLKPNARNESESMWYIFSSNVHSGPTDKQVASQGGPLKKILDLLWIKIAEKFQSLA